jgi:dihydroxyacetone kinase-like protein
MSKPKKILNNPADVVTEMLDGLVLASDGHTVRLDGYKALTRTSIPDGKVALLIGGACNCSSTAAKPRRMPMP